MNKDYDAYLFDWDGTAARTLEAWLEIMRESFVKFGMTELTDSEVASTFGRPREACAKLGFPMDRFSEFVESFKAVAVVRIPQVPLYDGVAELWEQLHNQGKKLAIVTANAREVIDEVLLAHNVQDLFSIVISGDDVESHKPDPEGVEQVLRKLGIDKSRAVMLGDSPHDLGAANNAGVDSVLYYPASHALFYDFDSLQHLNPTHTVSDWSELLHAD